MARDYQRDLVTEALYDHLHHILVKFRLPIRVLTAESCTGGRIAAEFTRRAGSSAYFWGGIVSYDNEAKVKLLGVRPETLMQFGAVSRETVESMLAGLSEIQPGCLCVAVSGVAGPGGGSPEKPVGTVWIGVRYDKVSDICLYQFSGDRDDVQSGAVAAAGKMFHKLLGIQLDPKKCCIARPRRSRSD